MYVWASGNGGGQLDRCDYDPLASSRYTIAIGAIGDGDRRAPYSEPGSSLIAVAHSSGGTRSVYTTRNNGYTAGFGGTSAACPLASGVAALVLEARPDLTWRDVRGVFIESARMVDPSQADWATNGAGFDVNHRYGFGAVDAAAAVARALSWDGVAHEVSSASPVVAVGIELPDNNATGETRSVVMPDDVLIEAVELTLNVTSTYIGDLRIELISPAGTVSVLADTWGDSQQGYSDYVFTSFRHYGEFSGGPWQVRLADGAPADRSTWVDFQLTVYGTPACPGDLEGSGGVGLADLALMLSAFGACEGDAGFVPAADSDNSNCNDLEDLLRLLQRFGSVCG